MLQGSFHGIGNETSWLPMAYSTKVALEVRFCGMETDLGCFRQVIPQKWLCNAVFVELVVAQLYLHL